jgi:hypothetical protein
MISKTKNIFLSFLIIAIGITVYAHQVSAQTDISISLTSDKTEITQDEDLRIVATLKQNGQNTNLNISPINIQGLENFQIVRNFSSNSINIINGASQVNTADEKVIIPSTTGSFTIGPATIMYVDPASGQTKTIESNTIQITVKEKTITKVENSDNPVETTNTSGNSSLMNNIATVLAVLITIGLIFFFFWYRKEQHKLIQEEREVDDEIIFPEIDDEQFIEKITSLLKKHLKESIGLNNIGSTTKEITEQLSKKKYYRKDEIIETLKELDRSKFAKSDTNKLNILEQIKKIIS